MYFSARTEGRISYGHLGRTDSCLIRNNSFYRITSNCKVFEFAQQLAVDYIEATVEREQWAVMTEDCDSDTGRQ